MAKKQNAPERKWAKITEGEYNLVRQRRAVEKSNPGKEIHWVSIVANDPDIEFLGDLVGSAKKAFEDRSYTGRMMAIVLKSADAPQIRRDQYLMLLQQLEERFGPRNDAEFHFYFGDEQ